MDVACLKPCSGQSANHRQQQTQSTASPDISALTSALIDKDKEPSTKQLHVSLAGILSLDTAWSSTAKGTVQGKVNVLLAVYPHNEGWHIHNLLANPAINMQLAKTCQLKVKAIQHESCMTVAATSKSTVHVQLILYEQTRLHSSSSSQLGYTVFPGCTSSNDACTCCSWTRSVPDVSLANQDPSMMDGLGQTQLENQCL